ncbi:MAG: hypothetical protein K1X44_02040 [Alphaproteobacteria bacterium]|nr:hypothetical protein [Alphaproteobacteria bacterium]
MFISYILDKLSSKKTKVMYPKCAMHEPHIDEILNDPSIQAIMSKDGVKKNDILLLFHNFNSLSHH